MGNAGTYLTVEEAAALLGLSYDALYYQIRQGAVPAVRVGTRWRVNRADLERHMKAMGNGVEAPRGARIVDLDHYASIPVPESFV